MKHEAGRATPVGTSACTVNNLETVGIEPTSRSLQGIIAALEHASPRLGGGRAGCCVSTSVEVNMTVILNMTCGETFYAHRFATDADCLASIYRCKALSS